MRVLIFSPEKPYTGPESIVTGKLMRAMIDHGWAVEMIFHEVELLYSSDSDYLSILEFCHGIENKYLKALAKKNRRTLLSRVISHIDVLLWIVKSYSLACNIKKSCPPDLVLSRIMPSYGHIPALLFKIRYRKIPWISNWSDPLPRIKAPSPYGHGPDARAGKLNMFFLRFIIKQSDWNTFPSERLMNYYNRYLPELKNKCSVLPHVLLKKQGQKIQTSNNKGFVLLTHIGSLGLRNPEKLIQAFAKIKETHTSNVNMIFEFVGPFDHNLAEVVERNNLRDSVYIKGTRSYGETLEIIRKSDLMLVIEAPTEEGIFLPSKVTDYLQCGKPILALSPDIGVMSDLLGLYRGGIAVDCKSVQKVEEVLLLISHDIGLLKEKQGIYSTDKLEAQFSYSMVIEKLSELFEKCVMLKEVRTS